MRDQPAYIALGVTATAYAAALNTTAGKRFAADYTWASVVCGVGLVLTILHFIMSPREWEKVVYAFIVAGSPMIVRSLINTKSAAP